MPEQSTMEMRYVIVDLEATCWEKGGTRDQMEIIEVGAVQLATGRGPVTDEFARFVRPVAEPVLGDFCTRLTSISQADVDDADTFPIVLSEFERWIGPEPFVLCSWGAYDLGQFRADCARHDIPMPDSFERHVNLKEEFSRVFGVRICGMSKALAHVGLQLQGTHHRGIDDARNISRLAELVLPQLEAAGLIELE
jgi:inhibitor of KinA sporulation pathway (predicted exonuclease)